MKEKVLQIAIKWPQLCLQVTMKTYVLNHYYRCIFGPYYCIVTSQQTITKNIRKNNGTNYLFDREKTITWKLDLSTIFGT